MKMSSFLDLAKWYDTIEPETSSSEKNMDPITLVATTLCNKKDPSLVLYRFTGLLLTITLELLAHPDLNLDDLKMTGHNPWDFKLSATKDDTPPRKKLYSFAVKLNDEIKKIDPDLSDFNQELIDYLFLKHFNIEDSAHALADLHFTARLLLDSFSNQRYETTPQKQTIKLEQTIATTLKSDSPKESPDQEQLDVSESSQLVEAFSQNLPLFLLPLNPTWKALFKTPLAELRHFTDPYNQEKYTFHSLIPGEEYTNYANSDFEEDQPADEKMKHPSYRFVTTRVTQRFKRTGFNKIGSSRYRDRETNDERLIQEISQPEEKAQGYLKRLANAINEITPNKIIPIGETSALLITKKEEKFLPLHQLDLASLTPIQAAILIKKLITLVITLDQHKLVHRNLTPENLLVFINKNDISCQVTGFELSAFTDESLISQRKREINALNSNAHTPKWDDGSETKTSEVKLTLATNCFQLIYNLLNPLLKAILTRDISHDKNDLRHLAFQASEGTKLSKELLLRIILSPLYQKIPMNPEKTSLTDAPFLNPNYDSILRDLDALIPHLNASENDFLASANTGNLMIPVKAALLFNNHAIPFFCGRQFEKTEEEEQKAAFLLQESVRHYQEPMACVKPLRLVMYSSKPKIIATPQQQPASHWERQAERKEIESNRFALAENIKHFLENLELFKIYLQEVKHLKIDFTDMIKEPLRFLKNHTYLAFLKPLENPSFSIEKLKSTPLQTLDQTGYLQKLQSIIFSDLDSSGDLVAFFIKAGFFSGSLLALNRLLFFIDDYKNQLNSRIPNQDKAQAHVDQIEKRIESTFSKIIKKAISRDSLKIDPALNVSANEEYQLIFKHLLSSLNAISYSHLKQYRPELAKLLPPTLEEKDEHKPFLVPLVNYLTPALTNKDFLAFVITVALLIEKNKSFLTQETFKNHFFDRFFIDLNNPYTFIPPKTLITEVNSIAFLFETRRRDKEKTHRNLKLNKKDPSIELLYDFLWLLSPYIYQNNNRFFKAIKKYLSTIKYTQNGWYAKHDSNLNLLLGTLFNLFIQTARPKNKDSQNNIEEKIKTALATSDYSSIACSLLRLELSAHRHPNKKFYDLDFNEPQPKYGAEDLDNALLQRMSPEHKKIFSEASKYGGRFSDDYVTYQIHQMHSRRKKKEKPIDETNDDSDGSFIVIDEKKYKPQKKPLKENVRKFIPEEEGFALVVKASVAHRDEIEKEVACTKRYYRERESGIFIHSLRVFTGAHLFIMTHLPGITWHHFFHYTQSYQVALRACLALISAVDDLNKTGIIHRDLHGGNVLVNLVNENPESPNINVSIIDFGLAAQAGDQMALYRQKESPCTKRLIITPPMEKSRVRTRRFEDFIPPWDRRTNTGPKTDIASTATNFFQLCYLLHFAITKTRQDEDFVQTIVMLIDEYLSKKLPDWTYPIPLPKVGAMPEVDLSTWKNTLTERLRVSTAKTNRLFSESEAGSSNQSAQLTGERFDSHTATNPHPQAEEKMTTLAIRLLKPGVRTSGASAQ